jgi:hypothetical protein
MELSHEICCMLLVLKTKSVHLEKALVFKKIIPLLSLFHISSTSLFYLFQNASEFYTNFSKPSYLSTVFLTAVCKLDKT